MTSPAALADAFDRIDDDNRRWIESGLKDWVIDVATRRGVDDWRTTGAAVAAGTLDALYTFLAMSGRGLAEGKDVPLGRAFASSGLTAAAWEDALMQLDVIYRRLDMLYRWHPEAGVTVARYTYH